MDLWLVLSPANIACFIVLYYGSNGCFAAQPPTKMKRQWSKLKWLFLGRQIQGKAPQTYRDFPNKTNNTQAKVHVFLGILEQKHRALCCIYHPRAVRHDGCVDLVRGQPVTHRREPG